jgi:hypothetical protein
MRKQAAAAETAWTAEDVAPTDEEQRELSSSAPSPILPIVAPDPAISAGAVAGR